MKLEQCIKLSLHTKNMLDYMKLINNEPQNCGRRYHCDITEKTTFFYRVFFISFVLRTRTAH